MSRVQILLIKKVYISLLNIAITDISLAGGRRGGPWE
jgi:hypothetical protein